MNIYASNILTECTGYYKWYSYPHESSQSTLTQSDIDKKYISELTYNTFRTCKLLNTSTIPFNQHNGYSKR